MLGNGGILGASPEQNQRTEITTQSPASTVLDALNLAQRSYLGVGAAVGIRTSSTVGSSARRALVFGGGAAARKLGNYDPN